MALLRLFCWALVTSGAVAVIGSFTFELNRPTIGVALIASGVISLLFLRSGVNSARSEARSQPPANFLRGYGPGFVAILLAPTVWILTRWNDTTFFAVVSIGAVLVAKPILDTRSSPRPALCLGAIALLHLELLWRMQQFSSGPVGIDPWFHVGIIRDIVASGNVPAAAYVYTSFPLFHIFGAQTALLLSLSPFLSVALLSVAMVLAPIFVFLVARQLLSMPSALLAALLFAVSDFFLLWTIWLIPMSLGIVFFAMVMYCAFSIPRKSWRIRVVLIIGMIAIIVLHPLVTIFAILALAIFLIPRKNTERAVRSRDALKLRFLPALFAIFALAWWIYTLGPGQVDVFATVVVALSRVLETFRLGSTEIVTNASNLSYSTVLGRNLGLVAILVTFPIGLVVLGREWSVDFGDTLRIGLPAITFMALPFVFGVAGQSIFLPDRWFIFGYIFAAMTSAVPIVYLRHHLREIRGKVTCSLVVGLFVIVMISNPLGNVTRPTYGQIYQVRNYFTDAEIQAPTFLSNLPINMKVIADSHYMELVLTDWYGFKGQRTMLIPDFTPFNLTQHDLLLIRSSLQEEPILVKSEPSLSYYQNLPQVFWYQLSASSAPSCVYDDGDVWGYVGS